MKTLILILCLLATSAWADTYILTIVPEKELDAYVINGNKWAMNKTHAEIVNKGKMPKYTKDAANYYISCMPVSYFSGKTVSDSWVTAEATKSKAVIVKTENPSEYLAKNGYKAPVIDLGKEAIPK